MARGNLQALRTFCKFRFRPSESLQKGLHCNVLQSMVVSSGIPESPFNPVLCQSAEKPTKLPESSSQSHRRLLINLITTRPASLVCAMLFKRSNFNICISRAFSASAKEDEHEGVEETMDNQAFSIDGGDDTDETIEEDLQRLLNALKKMEGTAGPDDKRVASACLKLAQMYDAIGGDPAKVEEYASRAIRVFRNDDSLDSAACYQCLGSACYKTSRFEECSKQMEQTAQLLARLEKTIEEWKMRPLKHATFFLLGHAKMALGRDEEAYSDYMESLAVNERHLEPDNPELAMAYEQVSKACLQMGKHEDAIALCRKALAISEKAFGSNSLQVALARKILAVIYGDLREYEKVLAEHEKIRPILESHSRSRDFVALDWTTSEALMALGRYDEAIFTLDKALLDLEETNPIRCLAFISQAKAYLALGRNVDAGKLCNAALSFLNTHGTTDSGVILLELAEVLKKLNETEQAILVLRQAVAVLQSVPEGEEELAVVESELGILLLSKHKVEEACSLLTKAVRTFEHLYGLNNEKLLPAYHHLGIVNLEMQKAEKAAELFEKAKQIAVDCLGPNDSDTIEVYVNLVKAYSHSGRYSKAIEYQRLIVETLRAVGERASFSLEEAEKRLEEVEKEAEQVANNKCSV